MVSTLLKNTSQNWNLPQVGVKIKNIWNHPVIVFFHLHQISASAARNSRAVWAPREVRQPHCQMRFEKAWYNPFVLGSWGDVLQGIHFLMLCQVPSPRGVATSLVFFVGKTNTERYYLPTRPPTPPVPSMRISIHVCWSAWVCVSLSTYDTLKRVGLRISIHVCCSPWVCVFDDDMMMIDSHDVCHDWHDDPKKPKL